MKDSVAIYWYLFWGNSVDQLNDLVTAADREGDFEKVEFFCKIIALKSMGMDAEKFWDLYVVKPAIKKAV